MAHQQRPLQMLRVDCELRLTDWIAWTGCHTVEDLNEHSEWESRTAWRVVAGSVSRCCVRQRLLHVTIRVIVNASRKYYVSIKTTVFFMNLYNHVSHCAFTFVLPLPID